MAVAGSSEQTVCFTFFYNLYFCIICLQVSPMINLVNIDDGLCMGIFEMTVGKKNIFNW